MSTDWRALCAELAQQLDDALDFTVSSETRRYMKELTGRARAALAQPEPEVVGPSDEEIMGLMPQQMHEDLAAAVRALAEQEGIDSTPAKGVMRIMLNRHVVDLARAALARFSHQSAPPGEGEVGELVAWLRDAAFDLYGSDPAKSMLTRAADLLEHQVAQAPLPVSERPWERDGWCHPQERWAWFYNRRVGWRDAIPPESLKPPTLFPYTHSLPFNALPLPSGEVQP